jgi:LPS-assembly lipoprotein
MSSADRTRRRIFVLAGASLLAGCGLRPLYGRNAVGAGVADAFAATKVEVIADRTGQVLRNYLVQRLNPAGRPGAERYRLKVTLGEREQDINIISDQTTTRNNLLVAAGFVLSDAATGNPLFSDTLRVTTSFNVVSDQFATLTAERDARDRALLQIADEIRTRLALYFDRHA